MKFLYNEEFGEKGYLWIGTVNIQGNLSEE